MKVKAARDDLTRLLDTAKLVVEARKSMPVLSHALLTAESYELVLRSTDLQVTYTGHCAAQVDDPGEVCLPARKLAELVKLMPAENVRLEGGGHDTDLTAAQVRYTLRGRDPQDFPPPRLDTVAPIYLEDAAVLRRALGRVAYAAAEDSKPSNICGVHLEIVTDGEEQVLRLVATDGHRLALADLELSADEVPDLGAGLLLPTKSVSAMHRVLGEGSVSLGLSRDLVTLNTNGDLLQSLPLGHSFPDYSVVIPQAHKFRAMAPRAALVEALKRMEAIARGKFPAVTLAFASGILDLTGTDPDVGEAAEHLEVEWEGEAVAVNLNTRYLRDACDRLEGPEVVLDFDGAAAPVKVHSHAEQDAGCMAVIMPMDIGAKGGGK